MQLEYTKAAFAAAWVLLMAGVAYLVQVASVPGWAVLVGLAVLPPLVMWRMWTAPQRSTSERIRDAIR